MKHRSAPALALVLVLVLAGAGTTLAQIEVAYAHVSLTVRYGGGEAPSFALDASLYPRFAREAACQPGTRCAGGIATPFGYVYDPYTFTVAPERHGEEIVHLRQWEALGPAYLLSYVLTGGDPFEPYQARGVLPATSMDHSPDLAAWNMERMWHPPDEMERSFPQFRLAWGGERSDARPSARFFPGYDNALRDVTTSLASVP